MVVLAAYCIGIGLKERGASMIKGGGGGGGGGDCLGLMHRLLD